MVIGRIQLQIQKKDQDSQEGRQEQVPNQPALSLNPGTALLHPPA